MHDHCDVYFWENIENMSMLVDSQGHVKIGSVDCVHPLCTVCWFSKSAWYTRLNMDLNMLTHIRLKKWVYKEVRTLITSNLPTKLRQSNSNCKYIFIQMYQIEMVPQLLKRSWVIQVQVVGNFQVSTSINCLASTSAAWPISIALYLWWLVYASGRL